MLPSTRLDTLDSGQSNRAEQAGRVRVKTRINVRVAVKKSSTSFFLLLMHALHEEEFSRPNDPLQGRECVQRFRVRHGLSCVIGPVWPVGAGCYSQAALPMPLSKPLYLNTLCEHVRNSSYDRDMIGIETKIRFPEILLLTVFIS